MLSISEAKFLIKFVVNNALFTKSQEELHCGLFSTKYIYITVAVLGSKNTNVSRVKLYN